jgi:2-phospho-L-lactate transferase/gluconeogenesis factor (CofD/UPF0052 family)
LRTTIKERQNLTIILILNLMTRLAEDHDRGARKIVEIIENAFGRKCDIILYNTRMFPKESLEVSPRGQLEVKEGDIDPGDTRWVGAPIAKLGKGGVPVHDPKSLGKVLRPILKKIKT